VAKHFTAPLWKRTLDSSGALIDVLSGQRPIPGKNLRASRERVENVVITVFRKTGTKARPEPQLRTGRIASHQGFIKGFSHCYAQSGAAGAAAGKPSTVLLAEKGQDDWGKSTITNIIQLKHQAPLM
jgi:hypothetical protein